MKGGHKTKVFIMRTFFWITLIFAGLSLGLKWRFGNLQSFLSLVIFAPPALISGILVLTFNSKLKSDKITMMDDFDYVSVCLD